MLSLVIDIRSDVIEGTLVRFPSEIIYSASVSLPRKSEASGERMIRMMTKGIEDLCAHIAQQKNGKIGAVHYILTSPWILSQSKLVKVEYPEDTKITDAVIQKIIEENQAEILGTYDKGMICIEKKVFAVELNGYPEQEYQNKWARTLQVSFAFSLSALNIVQNIEAAVAKTFHIEEIYYHSAILLQYIASRQKADEEKDYAVMHIHGELTDTILSKKNAGVHAGSFPFGSSTLVRKVSEKLGHSLESARSALALHKEGKLKESDHSKMESVINSLVSEWQEEYKKQGIELIPVHVFSDTPHLHLFEDALRSSGAQIVRDEAPLFKMYISALRDVI